MRSFDKLKMTMLCSEIAIAVKLVQCTSEIAIAVKFAAGELGDASNYRISLSVAYAPPLPWGEAIIIHCKSGAL